MVQRSKVLDIDGPTPKFLYAMLKQLDLKSIDWNRVAADIEISNGHAARMRFSRFRNQMEGTTGAQRAGRKKNAKKVANEKADAKLLMFANPVPGPTPMQTMDSFPYNYPIKCEQGDDRSFNAQPFTDMSEIYPWSQVFPSGDANYPPPIHPFMQHDMYHGNSYSMSSSMPPGFTMSSSTPPSFYPPFSMSQDFAMQELTTNLPNINHNENMTWETSIAAAQPEMAQVKIENDTNFIDLETEQNFSIKIEEGIKLVDAQIEPSFPVKIEEDIKLIGVKTEPHVPIQKGTYYELE
ncbi:hypothetical protein N7466_008617 [Penicillium verhagenii]|uniref:uncharacterized protein n=1 Tax=Penicillium verhagenii TaxID=1562060 RepID=UPI0025457F53|nr:uncharacterized protein N7466_008617 [Penicillium verhagenii]KAJ5924430.1 hypothetical protein N7466_008617 [Penicillium verhagenii]